MYTSEVLSAELPHIFTELPGPRARAVIERDSQIVSPSYTRGYPLVAHRAHGAGDRPRNRTSAVRQSAHDHG